MADEYWQRQTPTKALFPDIEWGRPEQRTQAGKLGLIGGNKLGFVAVADGYQRAVDAGAGQVRVLLPDALKRTVPTTITDVVFAASNPSGGLASAAQPEMDALGYWADLVLLIGDAGRNSETAIAYEHFITRYTGPLVITRDAVDLIKHGSMQLVQRPETLLVVSFAQLQKLFQLVYYPKILTFSMQLTSLVEALHKFTITYPTALMVLHNDHIIIAQDGRVITQEYTQPMRIWRGLTATRAAVYWLWHREHLLEAVATSVLDEA